MIWFLARCVEDRRIALASVGSLAVIGASAAPWALVQSPLKPSPELGLDADGKITILCGVLALVLCIAYASLRQRDLGVGVILLGGIVSGLAINYDLSLRKASARVLARLLDTGQGVQFDVHAALGLWITIAAGLLLLICGLTLSIKSAVT
ncbi:MAG: hypothetical protein ACYDCC_03620 [Actinomycetota bacterium]